MLTLRMQQWLAVPELNKFCVTSPRIPPLTRCLSLARVVSRPRWLSTTSVNWTAAEPDFDAARKWLAKLGNEAPLPEGIGEVSYARSSGPGGQNVNKVNSKAQLRVVLDQLLPRIPEVLHDGIRKSRYYAGKSDSILIQNDESRKQGSNKAACYRMLNDLVMQIYHDTVPGETSDAQKEKVKKLQRSENEGRLLMKKKQSSKKAGRQKGRGDD